MFDIKNKKLFLRRCEYPSLSLVDLYIGATVTIYARQLTVVEYGDLFTKKQFESKKAATFILFKPDVYTQFGKLVNMIYANNFTISRMKMSKLTVAEARTFYSHHEN